MDRRALRLIEALAETGHFGRAAEQLGVAQPHLSSALKLLEQSLGLRLFDRRPQVRLTPQGELLLQALQRGVADLERAIGDAQRLQSGGSGILTLGYATSVLITPLAGKLGAFRQARPDISLRLVHMHSGQHWEALKKKRIDLALTRELSPDSDFVNRLALGDQLVAVVPARHRLAREASPLDLHTLAGEPFVSFPSSAVPSLHAQIVASCTAAGVPISVAQEAGDWPTILMLVAQGFGVSLVPAALQGVGLPGIAFRPVAGPALKANIHISYDRGCETEAMRDFVAFLDLP